MWRSFRIFAFLFLLTGCGNQNSIYRTPNMSDNEWIVTDAQQRIITNTQLKKEPKFLGRVDSERIVCMEPSPDVAQAIQNAFSLAIESEKAKTGGSLGASSATALAQLGERLATIQLLRDEMADLCRSYANGAISGTTYTLRLSRLDNKMVTLLMAEMAAGAFGRSLASLGGTAQAATAPTGSLEQIEDARQEAQEAEDKFNTEKEKLSKIDKEKNKQEYDTKTGEVNSARSEYSAKLKTLHGLLRRNASAFAQAVATGAGSIQRASAAELAKVAPVMVDLQQNYLDDGDLGSLTAACISTLDVRPLPRETGSEADDNVTKNPIYIKLREELKKQQEKLSNTIELLAESNARRDILKQNLFELNSIIQPSAEQKKKSESNEQKIEENLVEIEIFRARRRALENNVASLKSDLALLVYPSSVQQRFVDWCYREMDSIKTAVFERYNSLYELRRIQSHTQVRTAELGACRQVLESDEKDDATVEARQSCLKLIAGIDAVSGTGRALPGIIGNPDCPRCPIDRRNGTKLKEDLRDELPQILPN